MKKMFKSFSIILVFTVFISCFSVITNAQILNDETINYKTSMEIDVNDESPTEKYTNEETPVEKHIYKPSIKDDVNNETSIEEKNNDVILTEEFYFSETLIKLGYQAESVEELLHNAQSYDRVDDVSVFNNIVDFEEGIQIFYGDIQEGMVVKIFYDGESSIVYLILPNEEIISNEDDLYMPFAQGNSPNRFVLPIDGMVLTNQSNGGNIGDYRPYNTTDHQAIDIVRGSSSPYPTTIQGARIRAVRAGTVTVWQESYSSTGYGCYVVVSHGNGLSTLYAHMIEAPHVSLNESVSQGRVLGRVGETGEAVGDHLHFEVRTGASINPNPTGSSYLGNAPSWSTRSWSASRTLAANETYTYTSEVYLYPGDRITIDGTFTSGRNVSFGLVTPDNRFRIVTRDNGLINYTFEADVEGIHYFRVRNNSASSVSVTGNWRDRPASWNVNSTVSANSRVRFTRELFLRTGDTVTINLSYTPSSNNVDFELLQPNNTFIYVNKNNGSVSYTFTATQTGVHYFRINNKSNSSAAFVGAYSISSQ